MVFARPTSFPKWATSAGTSDLDEPIPSKRASGFRKVSGTPEKPPYQEFNWYMNLVYQWTQFVSAASPAGNINPFAGSSAPTGWLLCDGSEVVKTDYPDLFAAIGTTWDTSTNPLTGSAYGSPAAGKFRLPDLRGSFLRGAGTFGVADSRNVTLAGFQADATAANGLTNANATSPATLSSDAVDSHSHTVSGSGSSVAHSHTLSGSVAADAGHTHTFSGGTANENNHAHFITYISAGGGIFNGYTKSNYAPVSISLNAVSTHTHTMSGSAASDSHTHVLVVTSFDSVSHTHTYSGALASAGAHSHVISTTAALHTHTISGDIETRPINVGMNFIIKY